MQWYVLIAGVCLYDWSGVQLDAQGVRVLHHQQVLLSHLVTVFYALLNQAAPTTMLGKYTRLNQAAPKTMLGKYTRLNQAAPTARVDKYTRLN